MAKMPFENRTYVLAVKMQDEIKEWLSSYDSTKYVIEPFCIIRFRDSDLETLFVLRWS